MKIWKFLPVLLCIILVSCSKDDDNKDKIELRDEAEVYQENIQQIENFLETHFYHLEVNPYNPAYKVVRFDTIAGAHANETPIMDSPFLKQKTVQPGAVAYTLYYLEIRKGNPNEYQPTLADKVVITHQASTMEGEGFFQAVSTEVIDLTKSTTTAITRGSIAALIEFKGASGFVENSDGTVTYNDDYGIGVAFVPSGLGYFQNRINALQSYQPFIVSFQLFSAVQMDHDEDGIPSAMENLNDNIFLNDDDTDKDGTPNYLDPDDDGDGFPTREEIEVMDANEDGIITPDEIHFRDVNNNGIPDHLDKKA